MSWPASPIETQRARDSAPGSSGIAADLGYVWGIAVGNARFGRLLAERRADRALVSDLFLLIGVARTPNLLTCDSDERLMAVELESRVFGEHEVARTPSALLASEIACGVVVA